MKWTTEKRQGDGRRYWSWLSDAAEWDVVRDSLDQRRFVSLYHVALTDPLVRCRKAELHLSIFEHQEALELLDGLDTPLANGLRMKALACMNRLEEVEALARLLTLEPSVDPLDMEGAVHYYEQRAWAHWMRSAYRDSLHHLIGAQTLARQLGLGGRLKVIATHIENVRVKLGEGAVSSAYHLTGNPHLLAYQREMRVKALLMDDDPLAAAERARELRVLGVLAEEDVRLVEATFMYRDHNDSGAALRVTGTVPGRTELRVFWALLMLGIFARLADVAFVDPKRSFRVLLESIPELKNVTHTLEDALHLYPLGVYLASHHPRLHHAFHHAAAQIPMLRDDRSTKDGLHLGNRVFTITSSVRKALLLDGLVGDGGHYSELVRDRQDKWRQTRFRRNLERARVRPHEFITITEAWRGLNALAKVTGPQEFRTAALELHASSPGLRKLLKEAAS